MSSKELFHIKRHRKEHNLISVILCLAFGEHYSRLGVAVVARSAMELAPSDQLTYKRIIGVDLKVQKALFWMKNRALSAAARHFVELIMEPAEKAKG